MEDISKIIFNLYKKNFKGIINIGSGQSICLKNIAKIICKKYKKKFQFIDNNKVTYLIADIKKLKKIFKFNFIKKIEQQIF